MLRVERHWIEKEFPLSPSLSIVSHWPGNGFKFNMYKKSCKFKRFRYEQWTMNKKQTKIPNELCVSGDVFVICNHSKLTWKCSMCAHSFTCSLAHSCSLFINAHPTLHISLLNKQKNYFRFSLYFWKLLLFIPFSFFLFISISISK